MTYSINRMVELKAKDSAMLRAMIETNNRIMSKTPIYTQKNINEKKNYNQQIYVANNNKFSSYMWLMK
jgi:hypothetical protein